MAAAKARLKAAKDAIAARDWARAKTEAESVLDLDPGNYNAHVFVGRAAQRLSQLQESEEAYRTAISFNGDQPLAWQVREVISGIAGTPRVTPWVACYSLPPS
ncbi:MAG: hypothetical protein BJ554DRAFT_1274 [Olpidium bornovanus]|uniref:Tetratricopeptide repeat protein n=1 Tax=Olpidium bornovanus TaxID=278681 RepID=A0A8H7ZRV6_9FUNG|nr:MAG: hypothetical protein BJ554DRAFT_1274 [Olpidium bornovanus]